MHVYFLYYAYMSHVTVDRRTACPATLDKLCSTLYDRRIIHIFDTFMQ